MGWVRIDDGFPRNPKVVNLTLAARWAYVEALCYAAEFETDGVVPLAVAENGLCREELVTAGLWEIGQSSITIHDFLVYNPSKEQKDSMRDSKRIAGAIGAATRYGMASDQRTGHSKGVGGSSSGLAVREKESFDTFWTIYPRKVGKRTAEAAFRRALNRGATVVQIIAGAERLRDDPNLPEAQFIPHPTTWLNRDGWGDDPLPSRPSNNGPGSGPDRTALALRRLQGKDR